ncbi:MAG TPA: hypothetical protein GX708_23260 [Gallicola sp.]|nr:hypothetical protein [Gallicola sp.]
MDITIHKFIEVTNDDLSTGYGFIPRPRIVCMDGFSMSVQASEYAYCYPRENKLDKYETVEVGYTSEKDILLPNEYDEIYAYIPIEIVQEIIEKHGGINIQKTFHKEFNRGYLINKILDL